MDFGNVRCVRTLDAVQYEQQIARTRLLVAHAGTGSILAAIERGIPVVILPRDPKRREHRDDHQIQTATKLDEMKIVDVAWSEAQLCELIEKNLSQVAGRRQGRRGGEELIGYIRDYLRTVLGPPLSPSTRCRASSRDT
jgi:UDP-N-acetylglucosamine transferase subunit ALG13